jgi:transcription termination factor Rho
MDSRPVNPKRTPAAAPSEAPPAFDLAEYQALPTAELLRRAPAGGPTGETVEVAPSRAELVIAVIGEEIDPAAMGTASGILDVRPEGFGFLRSPAHRCLAGADDVYLSPSQIRRLRLRDGHMVSGSIRQPRPGEGYFAMVRVHRIDGHNIDGLNIDGVDIGGLNIGEIAAEDRATKVPFELARPVVPHARLRLGFPRGPASLDGIDRLAPIGLGHRVLITAPRDGRRVALLRDVVEGTRHNHPRAAILVLLVDQAPETVAATTSALATGDSRESNSELFTTTFDESPERHLDLLRLVDARARRLVESGRDVVLLVDSLTYLVRACNATMPHSGKIISAGLDAHSFLRPKQMFSAARQIDGGSSLTIFATLLDDGPMNSAIAAEFAGRANADVVLDEALIRNHVDPPFDVRHTRTRDEDTVLTGDELAAARELRAVLEPMTNADAVQHLLAHPPTR